MPCDRILDCNEKSYKSWFDNFCCDNYKACYEWKKFNQDRLTPKEWISKLNLKMVDELYKRDEEN